MKNKLVLGVSVIFGLILRLINFDKISLWHDEAFSALLIKYPFSEMIQRIGLDVHPPVYYIALRIWASILGDGIASLRGFSVFFGVGIVWAVYALTWEITKNRRVSGFSALLVAVNAFQIQYASEARMYTMGAFFAVLAGYFLVKALNREKAELSENLKEKSLSRKKYGYYFGFVVCSVIISLTHYYLLFTAAALAFYALVYSMYLYKGHAKSYLSVAASLVTIAIGFGIYLPTFLYQFRQVSAGYWIEQMNRWSIPTTLWSLSVGIERDMNLMSSKYLVIATCVVLAWIIYKFLKNKNIEHRWLILLVFLAPFCGSILFAVLAKLRGSNSSVYLVRYFLYASSFLCIMLGSYLANLKLKTGNIILSAYVAVCLFGTYNYWDGKKVNERPGMQAAAKYLKANSAPEDKIYVASSFIFFNYKYYNQQEATMTGIKAKLFSGGIKDIKQMRHDSGTAILTNEDLLPEFEGEVKPGDKVWLIWTNGFGGSKPKLPENFKEVSEERAYPDIRPYVGTYIFVNEYRVN